MLNQSILQRNMQIYLQKMEEKYNENTNKLNQLQNTLNNAAKIIQNMFRRYRLKKNTRAAITIQRFFRKVNKRIKQNQAVLERCRRIFSSYKIYYFLKAKIKNQLFQSKHKQKSEMDILTKIRLKGPKFVILLSSLHSEIFYIKKYMAYDRKKFTEEWQIYEKKQKEWMWQQIRKKWVKKTKQIWINENQKEINAERYVNNTIQQCYMRHFEKYEATLKRLQGNQAQLKNRIVGLSTAFYFSLLTQI